MMLQKEDNEEFLKKNVTPNIVFIIPFRDREEEYFLFIKKMDDLLVSLDKSTYQYLFVHQCDKREFCRGGLKNIGFLVVKNTYPDSYLDITLVFNDIDTYPSEIGLITDYSTKQGIVKHFYGYSFALGGIVSITSRDFEAIHGFPNYWGWGFEDNMLNRRVLFANLVIDRKQFYKIDDQRIIQLNTSPLRTVNRIEFDRFIQSNKEGIHSINDLSYTLQYMRPENEVNNIIFANVSNFKTEYECNTRFNSSYDTRSTSPPFQVGYSAKRRATMNMVQY